MFMGTTVFRLQGVRPTQPPLWYKVSVPKRFVHEGLKPVKFQANPL